MDTQQDSIKEGGHGRKGKIKNAKNHGKSIFFFLVKKTSYRDYQEFSPSAMGQKYFSIFKCSRDKKFIQWKKFHFLKLKYLLSGGGGDILTE